MDKAVGQEEYSTLFALARCSTKSTTCGLAAYCRLVRFTACFGAADGSTGLSITYISSATYVDSDRWTVDSNVIDPSITHVVQIRA